MMTRPPLSYSEHCDRRGCPNPSRFGISLQCGAARVYFGLAVCTACGYDITIDDLVGTPEQEEQMETFFRVQGETEVARDRWHVAVDPLAPEATE